MTSDRPVTVLGAGYVGLVAAVGLAETGHRVHLVERASERRLSLAAGKVPMYEAGLQDGFTQAVANGTLRISDAPEAPLGVVLICVGTPISTEGRSDLSQIRSALDDIESAAGSDTTLVVRSTVPVGATRNIANWTSVPTSRIFTNPEFLRQGSALADFRRPARIVVGRFPDADPGALSALIEILAVEGVETQVVDITASELIKNGANAFLALKLSFANELAALAEEAGTDIGAVLAGIAADPRIGSNYLRPSFGFGGSCLPKELMTLAVAGRSHGLPMHVTSAASHANQAHQVRFADRVASLVGGLEGRTIGLLGLAFKAGTDDVRDSPAVHLAEALLASGARVLAYDPAANDNARRVLPELEVVGRAEAVFDGADAVVIGTEWPAFAELSWEALGSKMSAKLVIDGRRVLDASSLRRFGFRVATLGDGMPA